MACAYHNLRCIPCVNHQLAYVANLAALVMTGVREHLPDVSWCVALLGRLQLAMEAYDQVRLPAAHCCCCAAAAPLLLPLLLLLLLRCSAAAKAAAAGPLPLLLLFGCSCVLPQCHFSSWLPALTHSPARSVLSCRARPPA